MAHVGGTMWWRRCHKRQKHRRKHTRSPCWARRACCAHLLGEPAAQQLPPYVKMPLTQVVSQKRHSHDRQCEIISTNKESGGGGEPAQPAPLDKLAAAARHACRRAVGPHPHSQLACKRPGQQAAATFQHSHRSKTFDNSDPTGAHQTLASWAPDFRRSAIPSTPARMTLVLIKMARASNQTVQPYQPAVCVNTSACC